MKEMIPNEAEKSSPPTTNDYPVQKNGSTQAFPSAKPLSGAPSAPPPPPPHYFSYHGPPPSQLPKYDLLPPSSDRPGPYTAAQYTVRKLSAPFGQHRASPPSAVGRDPPPQHYPIDHAAPSHSNSTYFRDDPRHWPPHPQGERSYASRFYDTKFSGGQFHPPLPMDHVGPYRYSDPTLRREAVSRLSTSDVQNDVDGREGATSPSQIESSHREEVTTMGCTCKKTKCLKLYCQCFAVKIYCGGNCRCLICCNTVKHEKERQEAIRSILSRNPAAFDTKFKKTVPDKTIPDRALSHKLGCKCRKSACMKKYCECYAGSVKCSANCRCVGCKNMPVGGLPPPSHGPTLVTSGEMRSARTEAKNDKSIGGRRNEPWMMNAAHNLAILKHSSPKAEKRSVRNQCSESGEVGSMPSLGSEESPPAAIDGNDGVVPGVSKCTTSSEKTAVNALLMAAMAMTEMSSQAKVSTPPPRERRVVDEQFETPQKNLLCLFRSPKRKQSATHANPQDTSNVPQTCGGSTGEDSPKREHYDEKSPGSNQKVKRSRIGSLKKGDRIDKPLGADSVLSSNVDDRCEAMMETPKGKGSGRKQDLTPVSARCIDFRKMNVNETIPNIHTEATHDSPTVTSRQHCKIKL